MGRFRPLILAITVLLTVAAKADDFSGNYGIGTVHIVPYNFFSLAFYNNKEDVAPFEQIDFSEDKTTRALHYQFASCTEADTVPAWFVPLCFNTDHEKSRLEMFCIEKDGEWCRVVVNVLDHRTKWVHLGADVIFRDWNAFFTSMASIELKSPDPRLYSKADRKYPGKPLKTSSDAGGTQIIQAIAVNGMWMNVEVTTFTFNMETVSRESGWIIWRDENRLLVDFTYTLN
jgi:hypothetical protein